MTETRLPARYANGRFGPGNPGRPIGSRNRASNRVARNILRHFESNQDTILKQLSTGMCEYRALYVRLLCHLLPKAGEMESFDVGEYQGEEAWDVLCDAKDAIARIERGEGTLGDLEAALLGHRPQVVEAGEDVDA